MTDTEQIFRQIAYDRKINGYGDYHKKRKGGRHVRLPSDHMTKKERKAMNGECLTYNMSAPIKWRSFREWPDDIQREYLERLDEQYNASTEVIARMMNTSYDNIRMLKKALGIASKRGGKRPPFDAVGWAEFCGVETQPNIEKCSKTPLENIEKCPESPSEKADSFSPEVAEKGELPEKIDNSTIMNLAILLDALKGSGAKLTIEVTL